jgi:hypothetical protein
MTVAERHQITRFAHAARLRTAKEDAEDLELAGGDNKEENARLRALCWQWVAWCHSRRYYGPAPMSGTILGKLSGSNRRGIPGGPDAACGAELAAFHLAVISQPKALDRLAFEYNYLHLKNKNIKVHAAELGVSRSHWGRLINSFTRRVYAASREIMAYQASRPLGLAAGVDLQED